MPTSRAYDTRYAIHLNMLTHDSHGLHAVIINMDLRVHGHALYKRRHACSTTTNGCLGCYIKSTTWPQYKYGMPPRVHEHAGSRIWCVPGGIWRVHAHLDQGRGDRRLQQLCCEYHAGRRPAAAFDAATAITAVKMSQTRNSGHSS